MSYTDLEIPDRLLWRREDHDHEDVAAKWVSTDDVDVDYRAEGNSTEWDASGMKG
jgi:hypothetical protein